MVNDFNGEAAQKVVDEIVKGLYFLLCSCTRKSEPLASMQLVERQ